MGEITKNTEEKVEQAGQFMLQNYVEMNQAPWGWVAKWGYFTYEKASEDPPTFGDVYPYGAQLDPESPIPAGAFIVDKESHPFLAEYFENYARLREQAGVEMPTITTQPAAPGIVESKNDEGVQMLDSWAWNEKLMETRRQIAEAEAEATSGIIASPLPGGSWDASRQDTAQWGTLLLIAIAGYWFFVKGKK